MKTFLLLFTLMLTIPLAAQQYCDYDAQTTYDFGNASFDTPYLMLEQNDGKTLVLGTSYYNTSNSYEVSILRLNTDNTPDETFGENGKIGQTWEQRNNCISGALQNDGKILVGGYQAPGNGGSTFRPYVARLMSDGTPDASFGENGSVKLSDLGGGSVVGMRQMENGKIQAIFIDNSNTSYGMVQLDEFGAFDTTFGNNGFTSNPILNMFTHNDEGKGLFMEDGSAIVVGKAIINPDVNPCITKFTPEGDLDSNFADNGTLYIERAIQFNFAGIYAALTSGEDIIIAATSDETPRKYLLFKVNGNTGEMVSDFGTDGILESSQTASFNAVHNVVINPETGSIYTMGTGSDSGFKSTVWAVSSTGVEEAGCDGNAMQTFTLGYAFSHAYTAALYTSSGDLIIAGNSGETDSTSGDNQGMNFMIPKYSLATGIEEVQDIAFNIYPNPAIGQINISVEDNAQIDVINIYNQLGQKIIQENNRVNAIDVSSLSKGIYIVELVSGASVVRKKMIKN